MLCHHYCSFLTSLTDWATWGGFFFYLFIFFIFLTLNVLVYPEVYLEPRKTFAMELSCESTAKLRTKREDNARRRHWKCWNILAMTCWNILAMFLSPYTDSNKVKSFCHKERWKKKTWVASEKRDINCFY